MDSSTFIHNSLGSTSQHGGPISRPIMTKITLNNVIQGVVTGHPTSSSPTSPIVNCTSIFTNINVSFRPVYDLLLIYQHYFNYLPSAKFPPQEKLPLF